MKNSAPTRSDSLIAHLVQLSGLRKRDDLLSGITQALLETINAPKVAIFGLVHDENRQFWLPLTEALPGEKVRFVTDPMRGDPDMMAPVDSDPDRHQPEYAYYPTQWVEPYLERRRRCR